MTSKSPKAQGKSLKRAVLTGSLLQALTHSSVLIRQRHVHADHSHWQTGEVALTRFRPAFRTRFPLHSCDEARLIPPGQPRPGGYVPKRDSVGGHHAVSQVVASAWPRPLGRLSSSIIDPQAFLGVAYVLREASAKSIPTPRIRKRHHALPWRLCICFISSSS